MKKIFFIILSFLFSYNVMAQIEHFQFTGMLMDDDEYEKIPEQPMLLTRDYVSLPSSYSLQKYCPTPKNQGNYGTCTSWASAYAARTIAEAIKNGWTDREQIDRETFSPAFIYKQIKSANDTNCQNGSCISDAMALLKNKGVPKYSLFSPMCADYIPTNLYNSAYDYRIENYFRLFSSIEEYSVKVQKTKKAIAEDCPVIIGMNCYASFSSAKECWNGVKDTYRGGHAMCVVGYDDNKFGGAFLIMNSWGTNWGVNGFTWVKYSDYTSTVKYAYQLYVPKSSPVPNPVPNPTPTPASNGKPAITWNSALISSISKFVVKAGVNSKKQITDVAVFVNGSRVRSINSVTNNGYEFVVNQEITLSVGNNAIVIEATNADGTTRLEKNVSYTAANTNALSGSFYVQLATGEKMPVTLNTTNNVPTYKVDGSYISGTRYRVYISNNEPAFVYVIASDLTNSVSKVFPPTDNISPALVYKSNNIALPDEKWYMEMDNTVGIDYLCVLYSKETLDINNIIKQIQSSNGNFYRRIYSVLGNKIAKTSEISLTSGSISFTAQTSGIIVPVVLEIIHK